MLFLSLVNLCQDVVGKHFNSQYPQKSCLWFKWEVCNQDKTKQQTNTGAVGDKLHYSICFLCVTFLSYMFLFLFFLKLCEYVLNLDTKVTTDTLTCHVLDHTVIHCPLLGAQQTSCHAAILT